MKLRKKKIKSNFIRFITLCTTSVIAVNLSSAIYASATDGYVCSHGYHTLGDYTFGNSMKNKYFVIDSSIYDATYGTKYSTAVTKAVSDWENMSSLIDVTQSYTTSSTTKSIYFYYNSYVLDGGTLGFTMHYTTDYSTYKYISLDSEGKLTSNYNFVGMYINFPYMENLGYDIYDEAAVVAHEFGHAMGLSHRNTTPASIMCQSAYGRTATTPAVADVVTFTHLYG